MITFENLQAEWNNQPEFNIPEEGGKIITKKVSFLKRKQRITNTVLGITAIMLIGFFFYIAAYRLDTVIYGLFLMIGSLGIRVGIEVLSTRKLERLNIVSNTKIFKEQLVAYYNKRIKTHYIVTPLVVLAYCIGFVMLLPSFKANMSLGFYAYIVASSIVLLIVLGLFVAKQIKNEIDMLKELKTQQ